VPNLDTVVAFHATYPKHTTGLDPGEDSSLRTQRSQARRREATGGAGRRGVGGGGGGGEVGDGDQLTGGEPAGRETEAGAANIRLACVGHGKNSLLTRRHAGGAGDAASSEATYESARLAASRTHAGPKTSVGK
jgi:hypothetical protein